MSPYTVFGRIQLIIAVTVELDIGWLVFASKKKDNVFVSSVNIALISLGRLRSLKPAHNTTLLHSENARAKSRARANNTPTKFH